MDVGAVTEKTHAQGEPFLCKAHMTNIVHLNLQEMRAKTPLSGVFCFGSVLL